MRPTAGEYAFFAAEARNAKMPLATYALQQLRIAHDMVPTEEDAEEQAEEEPEAPQVDYTDWDAA